MEHGGVAGRGGVLKLLNFDVFCFANVEYLGEHLLRYSMLFERLRLFQQQNKIYSQAILTIVRFLI